MCLHKKTASKRKLRRFTYKIFRWFNSSYQHNKPFCNLFYIPFLWQFCCHILFRTFQYMNDFLFYGQKLCTNLLLQFHQQKRSNLFPKFYLNQIRWWQCYQQKQLWHLKRLLFLIIFIGWFLHNQFRKSFLKQPTKLALFQQATQLLLLLFYMKP